MKIISQHRYIPSYTVAYKYSDYYNLWNSTADYNKCVGGICISQTECAWKKNYFDRINLGNGDSRNCNVFSTVLYIQTNRWVKYLLGVDTSVRFWGNVHIFDL